MNNCGAYLIPFNRCKQVAIPLQYVGLYVGDYVLRTLRSDIQKTNPRCSKPTHGSADE